MQEDKLKILLANRIKKLREKSNLSQEDFGVLINIEQPNLSNLETGKNFPSVMTIVSLIEALKISPNSFFDFLSDYKDVNTDNQIDIEILKYVLELPIKTKRILVEILRKSD